MRICPRCQGRYDDESRFCPRDGAPLPARAADPRLGSVLLGQFELLEVCGRGAMGTVYRAWQSGMDREVAVKILRSDFVKDPAVVKRFHREARSVARLHHPNVVTVFLVGETDDHVPFMVMEYVDGEPLSSELAKGEALPVGRALRIARQIASALAEAHGSGIIHRDLKPANILLEQRRRAADVVKVVDFGIAKIVGGDGHSAPGVSALTHTGTIFGTPHYLSPEQAQGATVDGRADLYSLGVILYVMVTGRLPYEGSGMAVVVQHVNGTPPRPRTLTPELPVSVEALVERLMEKDPAARPQTAEDVSDAIDALLVELGEAAAPLARAESQPSEKVALVAAERAAKAAPPAVTIKATALAPPPPGTPPPALTVKGSALLAPPGHPLASAAASSAPVPVPMVTVKAGAISPGAAPPPASAVGAADATVPPPSRVLPQVAEPRLSAETAYAMAPAAGGRSPVPMSRAMAAAAAASALAPAAASVHAAPVPDAALSRQVAEPPPETSDAWRPPSPWRTVWLVLLALVFVGGAAAAGVYALKRSSARASVPASGPSAKNAGEGSTSAADAAPSVPVTTPPPKIGELPDAAVAEAEAAAAVIPGTQISPEERVITLGEGGWAVRVLLPMTVVAGADVDLVVEAWDPAGKPADAQELRLQVEEPGGLERALTLPAVEQLGRYQLRRRFAAPGRYLLRIFPAAGRTKPVVWFELQVADPATTGVLKQPEPARKSPGAAKKRKAAAGAALDPYHLLEELGSEQKAEEKKAEPKAEEKKPEPPREEPKPGSKNGPAPRKDPPVPAPAPPAPEPGGEVELE